MALTGSGTSRTRLSHSAMIPRHCTAMTHRGFDAAITLNDYHLATGAWPTGQPRPPLLSTGPWIAWTARARSMLKRSPVLPTFPVGLFFTRRDGLSRPTHPNGGIAGATLR